MYMSSVGPVTVGMLCMWYLCSVNCTLFVPGLTLARREAAYVQYKQYIVYSTYITYHYAYPEGVPKYRLMYCTLVHLKERSYSHSAIQYMCVTILYLITV